MAEETLKEEVTAPEDDTSVGDDIREVIEELSEETPEVEDFEEETLEEATPVVEEELDQPGPSGEETPDTEPIPAPEAWSSDAKSKWDELPRDLQSEVNRVYKSMQSDYTRKTQEVAEERRQFDAKRQEYATFEAAIQPYLPTLAGVGKSALDVTMGMIDAHNRIVSDHVGGMEWMAQNLGYASLQELADSASQTTRSAQPDPRIESLRSEVQTLKSTLAISPIEQEIQSFQAEVDESGNLLRPYFNEVSDYMLSLTPVVIQQHPNMSNREVLETVYNQAVRAHPEFHQKQQELERSRIELANKEAARKKAQAAKKASVSMRTNPGSSTMNHEPEDDSIRGILEHLIVSGDGRI